MVYIKEDEAKHVPGETSLYVTFHYRAELVSVMKSVGSGNYDKKTTSWEFPLTSLSMLIDLLSIYDDVDLEILPDKRKKKEKTYELMDYKTKPFDYQVEAIQKVLNNERLLLLADPGLGKTIVSIYAAMELKKLGRIKHCLVICGVNTLKFNWRNEIKKHSDETCRILGERTNTKGKIVIGSVADRLADLQKPIDEFFVITNIETLRDDKIVKEIMSGKHNSFDMIIVDELHKCKSPSSSQGAHLLKINKAKYLLGLTGTVLVNNPLDLYVPFKWLGINRSSYNAFKFYYATYQGKFNNILVGYKHTDVLQDTLNKYSLRQKKDLLNLPEKTVINELVEMDRAQYSLYRDIKAGIVEEIDKVDINTTSLLSMLTRLRQATSCPGILTTSKVPSSKIDRAVDLAEQIIADGEKVLIYSIFKDTVAATAEALKEYNPLICTGDTKDSVINNSVELFQNDDQYRIMIATPQKMGTGLTLTAARYVIFIDCMWTAADNQQAEDRCHRIGSKQPVFIYYLWNSDTVDLRVKELVENKGDLFDMMVNGKKLDRARLKELLIEED